MSELQMDVMASELVREARRVVTAAVPDAQFRAALLNSMLRLAPEQSTEMLRIPPLVFIPLVVHMGIRGDYQPALPVGVAALSLYLGIDQLDDVMDGPVEDLPGQVLIGATFTCAIAQIALAETDVEPASLREMAATMARGLLAMADGQHWDLVSRGSLDASVSAVERSLAGRIGGLTGMLGRLGALAAGADPAVVEAYEAWGVAYGVADQIRSDCAEVFRDRPSEDLRNGTLTYPLACLLESTPEAERPALAGLLRRADLNLDARRQLRELLERRGVLAASAAAIEWHCLGGIRQLKSAAPLEPACAHLQSMIERIRVQAPVFSTPQLAH